MKGLTNMEQNKIESLVEKILSKATYEGDKVNIIALAKEEKFAVCNANMDDDVEGFILIDSNHDTIMGVETQRLIGVNNQLSIEEKRFLIAHELGHYFLHYKENMPLYAHRDHAKGKDGNENDADYFSAILLMPKDRFTKAYREVDEKENSQYNIYTKLVEIFGTPLESVIRRIEELNLAGNI